MFPFYLQVSDTPLHEWLPHRDAYLDEFICHDGQTGQTNCVRCFAEAGMLKCKDCFGGGLFCQECVVEQHQMNPLHRIMVYFMKLNLISS